MGKVQRGFPGGASDKEPICQCRRRKRCRFNPCVGKIPWKRAWQPTPVFLPGKSHERGAWQSTVHRVTKQMDTTEATYAREIQRLREFRGNGRRCSDSFSSHTSRNRHSEVEQWWTGHQWKELRLHKISGKLWCPKLQDKVVRMPQKQVLPKQM